LRPVDLSAPNSEPIQEAPREGFESTRLPPIVSLRRTENGIPVEAIEVGANERGFL